MDLDFACAPSWGLTSSPVSKSQAHPNAILIAGPTASGKSALALDARRAARRHRSSTPIPCRSIATCASSPRGRAPDEEARVPHRLYGHVDAAENYSVGRWCARAQRGAGTRRSAAGRVPILVGGTGLYFKALTQGLVRGAADAARDPRRGARRGSTPRAPRRCTPSWRAAIRRWRRGCGPATACGSRRALEVLEATGRSLADWHRDGMPAVLDPEQARRRCFSTPDRAELLSPHRRALRRHAGGRRAGGGAGARRRAASIRCCRP